MTPLGCLGRKTSTQTKATIWYCLRVIPRVRSAGFSAAGQYLQFRFSVRSGISRSLFAVNVFSGLEECSKCRTVWLSVHRNIVYLNITCVDISFLHRYADPGVSLTLCCFVVYFTRRFGLSLALFWFFLYFSVLLALRLPRLGRELILVLFVRLLDLRLFGFVCFLFLFVSGMGCGL